MCLEVVNVKLELRGKERRRLFKVELDGKNNEESGNESRKRKSLLDLKRGDCCAQEAWFQVKSETRLIEILRL